MKPALKTSLDSLNKAIVQLESTVDKRILSFRKQGDEPQLDLPRNEREVNRKIATRLDQTIARLETLLSEA